MSRPRPRRTLEKKEVIPLKEGKNRGTNPQPLNLLPSRP